MYDNFLIALRNHLLLMAREAGTDTFIKCMNSDMFQAQLDRLDPSFCKHATTADAAENAFSAGARYIAVHY